jgi:membrane-bound lytic murein transglycosylase MltF
MRRPVLAFVLLAAFSSIALVGWDKQPAASNQAALSLEVVTERWTGDFEGMVKRRRIRILTPYNRTHYFVDGGVQRGLVYHAGVKYLRGIIDHHFHNESLDPVNRMLFAFAAYNCAPARLHQLRRETARRGLDPNLWFDHVERVAGQVVGRETVNYVSSIYKYYVAYKLAVEPAS